MTIHQLTERQERFISEYLIDQNASAAARRAGYSPKTKGSQAAEMMKHPLIAERIRVGLLDMHEQLGISAMNVMRELARAAFFDPREAVDKSGRMLPLHEMSEQAVLALSVNFSPRANGEIATHVRQAPRLPALLALARQVALIEKLKQTAAAVPPEVDHPWGTVVPGDPVRRYLPGSTLEKEEAQWRERRRAEAVEKFTEELREQHAAQLAATAPDAPAREAPPDVRPIPDRAAPAPPPVAHGLATLQDAPPSCATAQHPPPTPETTQVHPPQAQAAAAEMPPVQMRTAPVPKGEAQDPPGKPETAQEHAPPAQAAAAQVPPVRKRKAPAPRAEVPDQALAMPAAHAEESPFVLAPELRALLQAIVDDEREEQQRKKDGPAAEHAGLAAGLAAAAPAPVAPPIKRRRLNLWGEGPDAPRKPAPERVLPRDGSNIPPDFVFGPGVRVPGPWETFAGGPKPPGIVKDRRPQFAVGAGEFQWSDEYLDDGAD